MFRNAHRSRNTRFFIKHDTSTLNEKSKFFLASVNLEQFLANVDLSRQMRIGIKPYLVIILICLYTVQNILGLDAVRLSDLKVQQTAIISKVNRTLDGNISQNDLVASRLETLGFVPGTKVQVITKGIFGGDPILIQVGFTRFALRKVEAEKIEINLEGAPA